MSDSYVSGGVRAELLFCFWLDRNCSSDVGDYTATVWDSAVISGKVRVAFDKFYILAVSSPTEVMTMVLVAERQILN
jgi:hypothetical protein